MNYCDTGGQSGSKTIMFTVFGLLLDNVQLLNIEIKSQQSHFKPLNWRKLQSVFYVENGILKLQLKQLHLGAFNKFSLGKTTRDSPENSSRRWKT